MVAGFDGHAVPTELRALAREWDLGGVVLFGRNVEAPEQVAELAFTVEQLAQEVPLWVSVDQEGGRVARLRAPFTEWPPMESLGRQGESALAERFAAALADELSAVGITLEGPAFFITRRIRGLAAQLPRTTDPGDGLGATHGRAR